MHLLVLVGYVTEKAYFSLYTILYILFVKTIYAMLP